MVPSFLARGTSWMMGPCIQHMIFIYAYMVPSSISYPAQDMMSSDVCINKYRVLYTWSYHPTFPTYATSHPACVHELDDGTMYTTPIFIYASLPTYATRVG